MGKSRKAKRGTPPRAQDVASRRFPTVAVVLAVVAAAGAAGYWWNSRRQLDQTVASDRLPSTVAKTVARGDGPLSGEQATGQQSAAAPISSGALASTNAEPTPKTTAVVDGSQLRKLEGRWLRPDGGYVLAIQSVASDGQTEAAYSNPRPIHVSRAQASKEQGTIKLFVELRDVNYPGSTYTLLLSSDAKELRGTYFQAVARETYEVVFVRQ